LLTKNVFCHQSALVLSRLQAAFIVARWRRFEAGRRTSGR